MEDKIAVGMEHGERRLAVVEIAGTHVRLEKAAISAVLNTLHGSDGDVPKPLHDLAPNKHAADGKRAVGFPQRGRAGSSPWRCSIPTSWEGGPGGRRAHLCRSLGLGLSCIAPGRVYPEIKPSSSPAQRPLHLQELFTDKLHKFGGQPFYHSWQLCALLATR